MSEKNDGGQAFPNPHYEDDNLQGMSLRDYFAAKALQAIIQADGTNGNENFDKTDACRAYKYADAMILARGEA